MAALHDADPAALPRGAVAAFPGAAALAVLALGWLAMFGPMYAELAQTLWASDEQGHGPIVLAVGAWLLWRCRAALAALPRRASMAAAWPLLALAVLAVAIGRSQSIWSLEIGAQIVAAAALLVAWRGAPALRVAAFPLVFWCFMIPWPGDWVAALTGPMKASVSQAAAALLRAMGYAVGRSGVVLTVGPYQLLVADACAGLNSLFTLGALALLYVKLTRRLSLARDAALLVLVLPIAWAANVVRVMLLVLVTLHFGDAAGQGFAHTFAGVVLFVVALALIVAADRALGRLAP